MIETTKRAERPRGRAGRAIARLLAIPPMAIDVAIAGALVLAVGTLATTTARPEPPAVTALLALGAAATRVRRRWPLPVLAATLVPYVVAERTATGQLPLLLALYTVASLRVQRVAIVATAVAAVASVAAVGAHGETAGIGVERVLACALAGLAGLVVAERRSWRRGERAMLAELAASDERVRIARELHDVVAHHLSVMVVQGNVLADTVENCDRAFPAAQAIVASGRDALLDMRRILGVLRTHDSGDGLAPQPALDELDQLLERVRATGLDATLTIEGDPRALSTAVQMCAYRIVQEALTNVIRHAHASRVRVAVSCSATRIKLEITDDGIGTGPNGASGAGHGIAGMRERVALFGGTFEAGPHPGRGYRIRAELPL